MTESNDTKNSTTRVTIGPLTVVVLLFALLGAVFSFAFVTGAVQFTEDIETAAQPAMELSPATLDQAEVPGRLHDARLEYQYNLGHNPVLGVEPTEGSYNYPTRFADHQVHFEFADGLVRQVTLEICPAIRLNNLPTDASTWDALRDWELTSSHESTVVFSHDVYNHENMYVDEDEPTSNGLPYQESPEAADNDSHGHVQIVVDAPVDAWTFEVAAAHMDRWFAEALSLVPYQCDLSVSLTAD